MNIERGFYNYRPTRAWSFTQTVLDNNTTLYWCTILTMKHGGDTMMPSGCQVGVGGGVEHDQVMERGDGCGRPKTGLEVHLPVERQH